MGEVASSWLSPAEKTEEVIMIGGSCSDSKKIEFLFCFFRKRML